MSQGMTLQELAGHVAPELCAAHQEAVAVEEREIDPPESWRKEIERRARRYVVRQTGPPLQDFDRSDMLIAVTFFGVLATESAVFRWKGEVADWQDRIAEVRAKWRRCYKHYQRQKFQAVARRVVTGRMARAKLEAAKAEVTKLVYAAITTREAVVQATTGDGTRRQLAWAEVLEAIPEIESNSLTIKDVVWRHVEVVLPMPGEIQPQAVAEHTTPTQTPNGQPDGQHSARLALESGVEPSISAAVPELQDKFDAELRQRKSEGSSQAGGYRDSMVQWAKDKLTDGDHDLARQLWNGRSDAFPQKGGRPRRSSLKSGN